MDKKVFVLLCTLAVARAGVIGTHFSPSTAVSSVYSSINNAPGTPIYQRTNDQINLISPAPVYESVVSTHESNTKGLDGSYQTTHAKSLDTPYSSVKKYDSRTTNNRILTHSIPTIYSSPVHASYLYNPTYTHSVSPVTYTTHSASPIVSYSSPIVTKTITPGATYASHGGQAVKTTITYSEAPLVSHMTFTGLGTSYAW